MICKNESQKKLTTTGRRLGARALAHRDFAEYPQRVSRKLASHAFVRVVRLGSS